jgi:hypothetical protein
MTVYQISFVLFISFQPELEKPAIRNSLDQDNKKKSNFLSGVWMSSSKLLLEYYNTHEGWKNVKKKLAHSTNNNKDTILVKKFQRTQAIHGPDGLLRRLVVNEMDPVSQVVQVVAQKLGIKKPENFSLKILHPDGSGKFLVTVVF